MEFVYDIQEIAKSPENAIKNLRRLNINDRVKAVLYILDNGTDMDGMRRVLLKFWDILLLIRHLNRRYPRNGEYPPNEVLIKNTVTAYKILIVMRRNFFLADGVMLAKKSEDRSHRTLGGKKKLISDKVGKFSKLEFDAAYSAYTDRKK